MGLSKFKVNQAGRREQFFRSGYQTFDLFCEASQARKSCQRQLRRLNGGYRGEVQLFRAEVTPYWRNYGVRPRKMWYDLYCYKDNAYDPRYIPEDLYWRRIYPTLNKTEFRQAYTDKCFYQHLFHDLKQPRTIIRSSNHCLYNANGDLISSMQAKTLLNAESRFIVKPSIHSGEGTDILFFDQDKKNSLSLDQLMKHYRTDYIVQELVTQHPCLDSIHASSLNTIRIISFLFRGEVHISSAILRMGTHGSQLDNISAGGIACPILIDGSLSERAISRNSQWITRHPGGAVFQDIEVPSYERVIELVNTAHKRIPHFRLIGWDFAIDQQGEPVLIEYNGAPGMNQLSCGPLFGDQTEAVLNYIFHGEDEFADEDFSLSEDSLLLEKGQVV